MTFLNSIANALFDAMTAPFLGLNPYVGMGVVSIVAGAVMLVIFKYATNQAAMRRVKDRMMAHFLEVLIYRDDLRVFFKSQADLLKQNSKYTALVTPAALLMIPLVLPFLVQLELRYGHRPLVPGETVIVSVQLRDRIPGEEIPVSLETSPGLAVETPALRIRDALEADWRVRAVSAGDESLRFKVGDEEIVRTVYVGERAKRVETEVSQASFVGQLLHPGEKPLPRGSQAKRIEIRYPGYRFPFGKHQLHWLVPFGAISIIFGFALKPLLRVE